MASSTAPDERDFARKVRVWFAGRESSSTIEQCWNTFGLINDLLGRFGQAFVIGFEFHILSQAGVPVTRIPDFMGNPAARRPMDARRSLWISLSSEAGFQCCPQ